MNYPKNSYNARPNIQKLLQGNCSSNVPPLRTSLFTLFYEPYPPKHASMFLPFLTFSTTGILFPGLSVYMSNWYFFGKHFYLQSGFNILQNSIIQYKNLLTKVHRRCEDWPVTAMLSHTLSVTCFLRNNSHPWVIIDCEWRQLVPISYPLPYCLCLLKVCFRSAKAETSWLVDGVEANQTGKGNA